MPRDSHYSHHWAHGFMSKRFQNFDELKLALLSLYLQSLFNKYCPLYIQELLKKNKLDYNLRNSDFIIPRFNIVTCGKHSF